MKKYTIQDRFEMTLGNIDFQGGAAWDDIEKLEHLLVLLLMGKNLKDDFDFVENHIEILQKHLNSLKGK